jgi:hypothetical protein
LAESNAALAITIPNQTRLHPSGIEDGVGQELRQPGILDAVVRTYSELIAR